MPSRYPFRADRNAKNNVDIPAQLPRNEMINFVFDWGVAYTFPRQKRIRNEM